MMRLGGSLLIVYDAGVLCVSVGRMVPEDKTHAMSGIVCGANDHKEIQ